jgi:hypothetical protein
MCKTYANLGDKQSFEGNWAAIPARIGSGSTGAVYSKPDTPFILAG